MNSRTIGQFLVVFGALFLLVFVPLGLFLILELHLALMGGLFVALGSLTSIGAFLMAARYILRSKRQQQSWQRVDGVDEEDGWQSYVVGQSDTAVADNGAFAANEKTALIGKTPDAARTEKQQQKPAHFEDPDDPRLCSICVEREKTTVLLPCGHVLCSVCPSSLKSCPMCRLQIKDTKRIYY